MRARTKCRGQPIDRRAGADEALRRREIAAFPPSSAKGTAISSDTNNGQRSMELRSQPKTVLRSDRIDERIERTEEQRQAGGRRKRLVNTTAPRARSARNRPPAERTARASESASFADERTRSAEMNTPRVGSVAKVWTDTIPEAHENVPSSGSRGKIASRMVPTFSDSVSP